MKAARLVSMAVLVLSVVDCRGRKREPDPRLGAELRLRSFAAVHGTDVFRAELAEEDGASSYGRTRNVLFIDPTGQGRWLLPDNDHQIDERPISAASSSELPEERAVAIAALVRPVAGDQDDNVLLILDPAGRTVHRVADKVTDVLGVTLHPNQDCSILYEQSGPKYVLATFAHGSLSKLRDTVVTVPSLE